MKSITLPQSAMSDYDSEIQTETSLVFLGANGSGKTRLGVELEKSLDSKFVVRISAQKSLVMPSDVSPTNIEKARANLMFGFFSDNFDSSIAYKDNSRWGNNPALQLLNDYGNLLTFLVSDNYEQLLHHREVSDKTVEKLKNPVTLLDQTIEIWEEVIPHRKLNVKSGYLEAADREGTSTYNASKMSDGERVIFYLIGQCLAAPSNGTIIIDEPELHIHRSIQRKLWDLIEQKRTDCLFVYLTHDLEFASTRTGSVKFCLKEFDGQQFHWFPIPDNENIPEDVYLEIIGSRRPILFIEGAQSSYDKQLYSLVYPDFVIRELGSCEKVIQSTKAFNVLENLHSLSCFGIVDRDYRPAEYITSLEEVNIFCPRVAEVENLFLVEELLVECAKRFGTPSEKVEEIKSWIIQEFNKFKTNYALEATAAYINYSLNSFNGKTKNIQELDQNLSKLVNDISLQEYYQQKIEFAESLIEDKNYNEILKIFNHKSLVAQVGKFFDIKPAVYTKKVQLIIESGEESILNVIKEYLPQLNR
ncbi:AAA family ATPase [Priestia aryabhattai]|uniref:DUF4435 domain-containing protein n=1 Tax=Priestia aryabhattai TaxID=412384 RepID=UPI001C8DC6D8|nr:DUF4435 domain-containing protein [Priestia aryabhattai]MBY0008681.1 AAA family ATPase [Priestia aryabhattai]MBY0045297.1 AAA family ATPase [Priestia aryabhattai]